MDNQDNIENQKKDADNIKNDSNVNLHTNQKKLQEEVNKELRDIPYRPNEVLKRAIYFKLGLNINQFADRVKVSRQCIWQIITGRSRPSPNLAETICKELDLDTRFVFPDGSIEYPNINIVKIKDERQEDD